MTGIEVYLRQSGDRLLLNLHIPKDRKEEFLRALQDGSFEDPNLPMAFEAFIQEQWSTESNGHVRAAIAAINVNWFD